ncbi:Ubiquitinyl hydrolase 1 [Heracleum sosnowskyi]|uniref:ubiquitinyl hydrolase 1 n=1 Tax=Heracleum sosnowskyi TaxID=360622 RepID=A0AAD8IGR6_9APIA|nr:Ubiquitinyl hydrolase 1 [Heracleum sosnowskyi]
MFVVATQILEEEKNPGPHDCLINVYDFTKETADKQMRIQTFEEPFLLITHNGEILADVQMRIQKKLQVSDEEFSKPHYLMELDRTSSHFRRRDVYGSWDQYLGLEHSDTNKSAFTANQVKLPCYC